MAKTAATTTINPNRFAAPGPILADDAVDLIEVQNYAVTEERHTLASFMAAEQGIDGDAAAPYVRTHLGVRWGAAGSDWVEVLKGRVYIDPDAQVVRLDVGVTLKVNDDGEVRVTIGGASTTFAFSATGAGTTVALVITGLSTTTGERITDTDTLAVSSTGSGDQALLVEMKPEATWGSASGSTGDAGLDHFTAQTVEISATNLPSPD